MKIRLPADTRYYERSNWALFRTNKTLGKDAEINIGIVVPLCYDHQSQDAVPFQLNGKEYYLIVHEIRIAGLADKLKRLANLTVVK